MERENQNKPLKFCTVKLKQRGSKINKKKKKQNLICRQYEEVLTRVKIKYHTSKTESNRQCCTELSDVTISLR